LKRFGYSLCSVLFALFVFACSKEGGEGHWLDGRVKGAVQHGIFVRDQSVRLQPLADARDIEETTGLTDALGRFDLKLRLQKENLAGRLEGTGLYFNPTTGALAKTPITLRALTLLSHDRDNVVYLNPMTHLIDARAERLHQEGVAFVDALARADAELNTALVALGAPLRSGMPTAKFTTSDILGDQDTSQALTWVMTTIMLRALGSDDTQAQMVLDALAGDFAEDGAFGPQLVTQLEGAWVNYNADVPTHRLRDYVQTVNQATEVANAHRTVDSDLDGVIDIADNCRHTANSDQKDADEDRVGDACDMKITRVRMLSSEAVIGGLLCAVGQGYDKGSNPGLRCIKLDQVTPDGLALRDKPTIRIDGEFIDVALGSERFCVHKPDHTVDCWMYLKDGNGQHFKPSYIPTGKFSELDGAQGGICGVKQQSSFQPFEPRVGCWGINEANPIPRQQYTLPRPMDTVHTLRVGSQQACALHSATTNIICVDLHVDQARVRQSRLPRRTYSTYDFTEDLGDEAFCGIDANTGVMVCRSTREGDMPVSPPVAGYQEVALHITQACGLEKSGRARCWNMAPGIDSTFNFPPADLSFIQLQLVNHHRIVSYNPQRTQRYEMGCGLDQDKALHCWQFEAPPLHSPKRL